MPSNKCKIFKLWWELVGQYWVFQYVKDAYLANIRCQVFPLNPIHNRLNYWSWYTQTFQVRCKHQLMVVPNILLFLLMTILGLPFFISFIKNKKSLPNFKFTKHLWKIKLTRKSKCFGMIMVLNLNLKILVHLWITWNCLTICKNCLTKVEF
jgi:hypothetical protein